MPQIPSDLIVTPASVWHSPTGTTLPADTLAVGSAWPAGWINDGWTGGPLEWTYNFEAVDRRIEQSLGKVRKYKSQHDGMVKVILAELYLDGLWLGTQGTVTDTPADVGQPGKEELDVGDVALLPEYQWGFEGGYVDEDGATFPIRVFFWKGTARLSEAVVMGRASESVVTLEIDCLSDMTKVAAQRFYRWVKILEPATG